MLPHDVARIRHRPFKALEACKEGCKNLRSGDNDFSVNHLLLEHAALALLVRGSNESVSLVLEPLADTELVLCGTEETRLLLGVLLALIESVSVLLEAMNVWFAMDFGLTSYKQRRTLPCREEEAVSVLTAPILEKALEGAAR